MARLVFLIEFTMVSVSSGFNVRRSITSVLIPLIASKSAASSAVCTLLEYAINVISVPDFLIFAFPKGML